MKTISLWARRDDDGSAWVGSGDVVYVVPYRISGSLGYIYTFPLSSSSNNTPSHRSLVMAVALMVGR